MVTALVDPSRCRTLWQQPQMRLGGIHSHSCCVPQRFRKVYVRDLQWSQSAGCQTMFCAALEQEHSAKQNGPDISLLKLELQKEWHHTKNCHMGDRVIRPSSQLSVWWTCNKCPCGQPHEWRARVDTRQNMNSQCPFCTNRRLCEHNKLSVAAPGVAMYWDEAKNEMAADQITASSTTRRHWLCPRCGHCWQAKVVVKTSADSGCPQCSALSKPYTKHPSLTKSKHPAMAEFDVTKNKAAGLDPDRISCRSSKKVHWICRKCPKGQLHLFESSPDRRIGGNIGCPYCSSNKACICNSLQSLYPALAKAWDAAKNDVGADQVLARSRKSAYWKDAAGQQSPFDRTKLSSLRVKRATLKEQSLRESKQD